MPINGGAPVELRAMRNVVLLATASGAIAKLTPSGPTTVAPAASTVACPSLGGGLPPPQPLIAIETMKAAHSARRPCVRRKEFEWVRDIISDLSTEFGRGNASL
jgi:hypothetical protein